MILQAPFPWFGGKSKVTHLVWDRFGDVANYVEPFFGSGAVLLGRPNDPRIETVNDKDGFVANFWRALKADPEAVAAHADWPVNENDLHARHAWLTVRSAELSSRLEGDPDFYDAKIAGWWVWGMAVWIGGGFCSGQGPWVQQDGQLVHLGGGRGVNRKLEGLYQWFDQLSERLRNVRVCCGDWSRVCGPTPTIKHGLTGVFLDPPYSEAAGRDESIYSEEDLQVAVAVREWAIEWGEHPLMRIALCGYEGEHQMPKSWECVAWKACGGYGSQGNGAGRENAARERIWFSPGCLQPSQLLFPPASRPKQELANLSELYQSGHPDKEGLRLAMEDWIYQDAAEELGVTEEE